MSRDVIYQVKAYEDMALRTPSTDTPDDITLMLRVREGDRGAFEGLYGRYHSRLQHFFFGMSRDTQTAYDLCQDTFLRVWQLRQRYHATGSFKAYLYAIGRHIWLEHCRRLGREYRLGLRTSWEDALAAVDADSRDPGEVAAQSELRTTLLDALEQLPDDQRMAVVLRVIEGLTLDEIASVLQCPKNTVRSRKLLGIKKLREAVSRLMVL